MKKIFAALVIFAVMASAASAQETLAQSSLHQELTAALRSLHQTVDATRGDGQMPPLVTPPGLRVGIRRLVEPILPRLPVISLGELPAQTPIQNISTWELTRAD